MHFKQRSSKSISTVKFARVHTKPRKSSRLTSPLTPKLPFIAKISQSQYPLRTLNKSFSSTQFLDESAPIDQSTLGRIQEPNFFGSAPPAPKPFEYKDELNSLPNIINKQIGEQKKPLLSLTLKELELTLKELGMEKYRAKQIFQWIYQKGAIDFNEMTNLPKKQIELLKETFFIFPIDVKYAATATDGTKKYVIQIEKKAGKDDTVESVFIPRVFTQSSSESRDQWDEPDDNTLDVNANYDPTQLLEFQKHAHKIQNLDQSLEDEDGFLKLKHNNNPTNSIFVPDFIGDFTDPGYTYKSGSVCFSSQLACSTSCSFCHTGSMAKSGLRNLTTGEIVGQIMAVKHSLNDFPGKRPNNQQAPIVSSLVAMGMGEPGYNINNLLKALDIIMSPDGLGLGRRHITISTSGVVTAIDKLATLPHPPNLAISLHATNDELRSKIMPINKTFPLNMLMDACRRYPGAKKTRKITFEYIMLSGVNDSDKDAYALLDLIDGIPSLVNCIPFNPWGNCSFDCSSMNRMRAFTNIINNTTPQTGIRATIRKTMGQSQLAACGTLNSKISTSMLKQNKMANALNINKTYQQQREEDMNNIAHIVMEATKL